MNKFHTSIHRDLLNKNTSVSISAFYVHVCMHACMHVQETQIWENQKLLFSDCDYNLFEITSATAPYWSKTTHPGKNEMQL